MTQPQSATSAEAVALLPHDEMAGELWPQIASVKEAAMRATTQLTDAQVACSEGDWRVEKVRKYADGLAQALDTLRRLAALQRPTQSTLSQEDQEMAAIAEGYNLDPLCDFQQEE